MHGFDMVSIVPLEYKYCEQVHEIAKECLPEAWSLDGIRDVLKYDNNIYYVAVDKSGQKVVGFGGIMIVADEAELLNIAVTKSYRQLGIAGVVLNELMSEAEAHGAYRMLLEVREHNDTAGNFYVKNGFKKLGVRTNYYENPVDNAVIMEKIFDKE